MLGGTGLMNKSSLIKLNSHAHEESKEGLTSLIAKETFTNVEIETLLRSHNETLSMDQSVRR